MSRAESSCVRWLATDRARCAWLSMQIRVGARSYEFQMVEIDAELGVALVVHVNVPPLGNRPDERQVDKPMHAHRLSAWDRDDAVAHAPPTLPQDAVGTAEHLVEHAYAFSVVMASFSCFCSP